MIVYNPKMTRNLSRRFRRVSFSVIVLLIAACNRPQPASVPAAPKQDFLVGNMDASVNPGEDFFEYANGGWLKRNPIPASESNWGIGNVVRDELYEQLKTIDEAASKQNAASGTDGQKVGDFWTTAMDEAKADQLGIGPLQSELERINSLATVQDTIKEAFELHIIGVDPFFNIRVSQDEKKSDTMAVHVEQGGLGLPERDFYFNNEAGVAKIRQEYIVHLQHMLKLLGESEEQAAKSSADVMQFETALAKASRKLEELRDPQKNYNKMTPAELRAKDTPSIDWVAQLDQWKIHPDYLIVGQPEFFRQLDALINKTPEPVLKDYLRFHLVSEYAPYLSKEVDSEDFNFYHRILSGQKEPRPRWKRTLDAENRAMGMVLGRMFVKEYFPEAAKKRYSDLVEAIRTAYSERIDQLEWMSDATKAKAHQKLSAVTKKVGYPDKWKDYSKLTIGRESFCDNMMNAARWRFDDNLSKFGKPVDRSEWDMTPQTYNAYYNPSNNEIVLPAAIFEVPGVRDSEVDDAVVYGYVGASTIGHEITHGFDDEGRQYDAAGNLVEWWTKQDAAKFQLRAAQMVKEFDAYEPMPGLHINGKASLGENIADYGGILLGLDAFKKTEQYKTGKTVGGLTPLQRFFLGYALGWLDQQQEQSLRRALLSDVHAPPKWRVLGPLSNIPEFYDAFSVKQGQPMWRPGDQHVHIW
jgi:putative endopeptidase